MNKKVVIAVVAVLVLAGGAFALSRRKSSPVTQAPADQSTLSKASEATEFATAMTTGRPTACVLTKDNSSMTYHLKGKMMRIDYTMASPESSVASSPTTLISHMINDTQFMYTWTDGQKQGTKFAVTAPASPTTTNETPTDPKKPTTPSLSNESDYNALKDSGYTINCQASNVTDADFVPPTDVTFLDTAAMMRNVPSPAANGQVDYQKLQEQYGKMMPQ